MHLLGGVASGPSRRLIIIDGDCSYPEWSNLHRNEGVATKCHFASKHRRPEVGEHVRILTVKGDGTESNVLS